MRKPSLNMEPVSGVFRGILHFSSLAAPIQVDLLSMQPEIPDVNIGSSGDLSGSKLPQNHHAAEMSGLTGRGFWGPDAALAGIYRVMKPGAVFASYVFGLADQFGRQCCPQGRYLTESPILRGMYEELERITGVLGLADAISTDPPSIFPSVARGSGLHDYFVSKLSRYGEVPTAIKYEPLLIETSPHLLVEMAETQTAGHAQHFITGRSDLLENMTRFAQSCGEGHEQV